MMVSRRAWLDKVFAKLLRREWVVCAGGGVGSGSDGYVHARVFFSYSWKTAFMWR